MYLGLGRDGQGFDADGRCVSADAGLALGHGLRRAWKLEPPCGREPEGEDVS